MSFFYELNQRMAKLAEKQDAMQTAEQVKATAPRSQLAESLDVAEAGYSAKAGRAGKDLGKPGKNFDKIAKSAGERYGSKAAGERVAGAVLNKLRHPKEGVEESTLDGHTRKYGVVVVGHNDGKPVKMFDKESDAKAYADKGIRIGGGLKQGSVRTIVAPKNKTEEGNAFTGALKATPTGGKFKVGGKEFTDTSSLEEGHCPTCDCSPCKCDSMGESALQAAIGKKKYGDQGMKALQKAGREHASDKTMSTIRNRYDKYDESVTDEGNEFTGNLAKAKAQHKDEFEVDGKKYKVVEADPTGLGEQEVDEGFAEMDAWLASREKAKGTGRFDKKKTSTGTVYTRKSETFDDPETDPEATGGAPKRVGRPKGKDKGPERVTAKSYKYKTGRPMETYEGDLEGSQDHDEAGEFGAEGDYVKNELHTMVRVARDLEKHLRDNEDLPTWCIGKLSQAKGMLVSVMDYIVSEKERGIEPVAEKSVSKAQRKFMGMAHAMQKGEKIKGASPELKKVAKTMKPSDTHDFAVTKEKELPNKVKKTEEGAKPDFLDVDKDGNKKETFKKAVADKKEEKVDETTTSGSVATAPAAAKSTKGMQFGKGVYESINTRVEGMITESMNITVNMSTDEHGEPHKSVTVTADGDDADKLAELLKMAGLGGQSHAATCDACGQTPCGCAEVVDENSPDWPTDTETLAAQPELRTYSGGLNGPKSTGQTTIPVIAGQLRRQTSMEENVELERSLFKTWKNYKG